MATNSLRKAMFFIVYFICFGASAVSAPLYKQQPKSYQLLHDVNYVLPYNYVTKLNRTAIPSEFTNEVKKQEFKGQLSVKFRIFQYHKHQLFVAYNQKSYWQLYSPSPFFRDTTYYPEIFATFRLSENLKLHLGADHQSNGRGNEFERSWNRSFVEGIATWGKFRLSIKPWYEIFKSDSIDLHNPDIVHFLGRSQVKLLYSQQRFWSELKVTNLESGFSRGFQQLNVGYKVKEGLHLYCQIFRGYGQSLIDYNLLANSYGIGFAFNQPNM